MLTQNELEEVYKSLCANGLTSSVASFLTSLLARIDKLEEPRDAD